MKVMKLMIAACLAVAAAELWDDYEYAKVEAEQVLSPEQEAARATALAEATVQLKEAQEIMANYEAPAEWWDVVARDDDNYEYADAIAEAKPERDAAVAQARADYAAGTLSRRDYVRKERDAEKKYQGVIREQGRKRLEDIAKRQEDEEYADDELLAADRAAALEAAKSRLYFPNHMSYAQASDPSMPVEYMMYMSRAAEGEYYSAVEVLEALGEVLGFDRAVAEDAAGELGRWLKCGRGNEAKAAAAAEAASFETRDLLYSAKTAALGAAVSRIRANLAPRSIEAAEAAVGERIPRAKTLAILEEFYARANPDNVRNAGGWIDVYEGCEELLYERLEQKYDESVPGGPFKVWREGPPFPAPEATDEVIFDKPIVVATVVKEPDGDICDDSCEWANDGVCDDGTQPAVEDDEYGWDDDWGGNYGDDHYYAGVYDDYYGSQFDDEGSMPACAPGTDCTDCQPLHGDATKKEAEPVECDNTCAYARDGFCDDPRQGGECALGTDCQDCGPASKGNFSTYEDDTWWDDDESNWYWDDDYADDDDDAAPKDEKEAAPYWDDDYYFADGEYERHFKDRHYPVSIERTADQAQYQSDISHSLTILGDLPLCAAADISLAFDPPLTKDEDYQVLKATETHIQLKRLASKKWRPGPLLLMKLKCPDGPEQVFGNGRGIAVATILPDPSALGAALTRTWRALRRTWRARAPRLFSRNYKARARRERIRARASRVAASLLPTVGLLVAVVAVYAVAYMLAARRRRREHVAATEFKAKVAPYLVEAPEL